MSHQYMPFSVTFVPAVEDLVRSGGRLFQVSVAWLHGASTAWHGTSPTSLVVSPNTV